MPYPIGYRHDLSLIIRSSEKDLPDVVPPPGVKILPRWANLAGDLSGIPMFTCALSYGRSMTKEGQFLDEKTRTAIIEASGYYWDKQTFSQSASILWRTEEEPTFVGGYSGSVLCTGKPDKGGKPLAFQNFQQDFHGLVIKGGFVLPEEVRESEILLGDQVASVRRGQSNPQKTHGASTRKANLSVPY